MRRLLEKLGFFSLVWSRGAGLIKPFDTGSFAGWRVVRYDKKEGRFFIWLSRCIDHKLYLDDQPQVNDFYKWLPTKPGKKCSHCGKDL